MSLTTSAITGRVPLPNNAVPNSVEVIFTLNGLDTEGVNTLPPESSARFQLTASGEFPAGAQLWRNLAGLRGTSYRVEIRWTENVNGREVLREAFAGYVQIGDEAAYTLADLLASPAGSDPAIYVNVPQGKWQEFNDRLDYMYEIAESSLPATVERAVEAELAAKASEEAAAASAEAAAGSATQAVEDVNAARDGALTAIGTAETNSVGAVETTRDDAIALINPKVQEATTAAQTATTKAGEAAGSATAAGESATAADGSAGAAAGSATAAGQSAQAAADSAAFTEGQAGVAVAAAGQAGGYLQDVQDASDAALESEIAARSSEVAAAGSAGAAASSATAANSSRAAALSSASAAALSAGSANDAYVATQDLMDEFANFRFLGKVEWWIGSPSMIPSGFLPMNGQLGNRADYPDIWEDISNGVFVSVTDALWLNGPNTESKHRHRASFSTGNGSTTFRFPDLNGAQTDSLKGLFLRGGQNSDGLTNGQVFRDAIRNITGGIGAAGAAAWQNAYGALYLEGPTAGNPAGAGTSTTQVNLRIDAARIVPTASENRPVSAVGTWIMLVNGAPARQFNPETSAGLGSNTFGGLQKFNAGFEFTGVIPQLIQTDVEQGLTVEQKLRAAINLGGVSYASPQTLLDAEKAQARGNIGLGSAATRNTGTSGANVPLMNGQNSWSGIQRFLDQTQVRGVASAGGSLNIAGSADVTLGVNGIYSITTSGLLIINGTGGAIAGDIAAYVLGGGATHLLGGHSNFGNGNNNDGKINVFFWPDPTHHYEIKNQMSGSVVIRLFFIETRAAT